MWPKNMKLSLLLKDSTEKETLIKMLLLLTMGILEWSLLIKEMKTLSNISIQFSSQTFLTAQPMLHLNQEDIWCTWKLMTLNLRIVLMLPSPITLILWKLSKARKSLLNTTRSILSFWKLFLWIMRSESTTTHQELDPSKKTGLSLVSCTNKEDLVMWW